MLPRVWRQRAAQKYVSNQIRRVLGATQLFCPFKICPLYVKTAAPYHGCRFASKAAGNDCMNLKPTEGTTSQAEVGGDVSGDDVSTTSSSVSPLRVPTTPQPHDSLTSFLEHAAHSGLSHTSTTFLGTRYEYLIQKHLSTHLAFDLTRIGGRGDSGIDLLGTWELNTILNRPTRSTSSASSSSSSSSSLPSTHLPAPIPILIQCKRLSKRPGPNLIRELEGSFLSAPINWRSQPTTLGILICSQPATKGVRDAMGKSSRSLMWCCIEELDVQRSGSSSVKANEVEEKGETSTTTTPRTRIRQILWNSSAATRSGLEGLNVGMKYINHPDRDHDGNDSDNVSASTRTTENGNEDTKEVILLWQGREVDFRL